MDASLTDAASGLRCVYVLSDVDGYKYKLVMQGDVRLLSVRKIKRYLQRSAGIEPAHQLLTFNGASLADTMSGEEAGLFDGAILRLQQVPPSSTTAAAQRSGSADAHQHSTRGRHEATGTSTTRGSSHRFSFAHPEDRGRLTYAPQKDGSVVLTSSPLLPVSTARAAVAVAAPQLIRSARGTPLRCLSPNKLAAEADGADTGGTPSAKQDSRGDNMRAYCRELEARIATLSVDNVRLREQLQVVARQAAEAFPDWKLEEEVSRLKAALAQAQRGVADATRAAAERWRVKEEELVKELDLLREERRRLQEETVTHESRLQELVRSMEGEIRGLQHELHDKEEALQAARVSLATARHDIPSTPLPPHSCASSSLDELAGAALRCLTEALDLTTPLELDGSNDTCVVPVSDALNVLITLDRESEHMFLYATLLNDLPSSPVLRLRLYEMLLQGALLGRDTAGGGVGVSLEANLVLMGVSAPLRYCEASALAVTAAPFVAAAQTWTERIDAVLGG
ncbi:Tir chaperone protein (CesT) family [Novymonas esmeraldas]|uniref:Tir chaperone protein (CesT) family n=1 Tax=Novymonas esmeraldas TaxID=1808958 RepID=A0AAW0EQ10_9TRYP